MAQTLPLIDSTVLQHLLKAEAAGDLRLVDVDGKPLAIVEAVGLRCWAHLRDAQDGQVFVQELQSSRELLEPRYLELLGINV